MMKRTLREIAKLVKGRVIGDEDIEIDGVGGAENANSTDITFALNEEFLQLAQQKAGAIFVVESLAVQRSSKPLIIVDNPRLAFAKVAKLFAFKPYYHPGISKNAYIDDNADIGENVSIHAGVTVESGAKVGDNVVLAHGVYIGHNVIIGQDSIIHPNVVVEYDSQIGKGVEIHPNTVIGSEGYGFEPANDGYVKIPQFGNVVIEDDVEIGSNVTIDRAATASTIVGKGTKIDNLVHIAHNVEIGSDCLIVAQVGIAGSAKIGNRVTLAGKSGVVGHLTVGDNTTLISNSVITNDVPPNSVISGYPAHDHRLERRIKVARKKLPDLLKKVRKLEEDIKSLEEKLEEER
ncbi:UDP-3-O-[3-hydroxymyristoyl] glucosamine N-acyltransferase [Orenia metallireducens]|uniref:UDP-3-O-acylglucosamine N-acyltransferase n=2 Tax=Orenia metallireducens TaxID=1413210 RepID=A0A285GL28_9FIRM|nr:UDP-3-O-[3-hydroxymyristoyl] glucosamine N-acyltransferase [Orenia metallireducens]SNY24272.1 UDP-3-O-[3-hydroxymyristoyl] glucosamine N-acyltransferase [Orenia metallireducens]